MKNKIFFSSEFYTINLFVGILFLNLFIKLRFYFFHNIKTCNHIFPGFKNVIGSKGVSVMKWKFEMKNKLVTYYLFYYNIQIISLIICRERWLSLVIAWINYFVKKMRCFLKSPIHRYFVFWFASLLHEAVSVEFFSGIKGDIFSLNIHCFFLSKISYFYFNNIFW